MTTIPRKSPKLLKPGKTYTFTIPYNSLWSGVYTGVFIEYNYRGRNEFDECHNFRNRRLHNIKGYRTLYLFNVLEGKYTGEIMLEGINFITAKHALMAKQVARGTPRTTIHTVNILWTTSD